MNTQPFLVGNEWRLGTGTFDSINPADGSVAARIAKASAADVDDAVRTAAAALESSRWSALSAPQRAALLHRLAALVEHEGESLALMQTQDNGKALAESRAQVRWAADMFRYYASVCETFESAVIPARGDYFSFSLHEPVGVMAATTPWNSPISLEAQKLAPALAAGNTVVLKSSDITPQVGLAYARLALQAGFPPGVLNVVTGGLDVGQALANHPLVSMITFTGGAAGGRAIARSAAERLVPALLELGGKSPNVVFDDADIPAALAGVAFGIFHNAGQSCIAGSRVFVQRSLHGEFSQRLSELARNLVVGDPLNPATAVAPVSSFAHRERIEHMLERAREEGAQVLCGGGRPTAEALAGGAYLQPTVLQVPSNRSRIAQEEIFGPVACLLSFDDEDDLVQQANDTIYGLACGIWTADYRRALRVGRRIRSGMVWVNTYKLAPVNMPFGGVKASGIGRECGLEGLRPYLQEKSMYLGLDERPIAWPPAEQRRG